MTEYMPRSAWASRGPVRGLTAMPPALVEGFAVHWPGDPGTSDSTPAVGAIAARLEAERVFHVDKRKWSDIAYCLPSTAEALTDQGWKRHDQIGPEDRIYTLNQETMLGEWQTPSAINIFSGPRMMLKGVEGILSTPEHAWPVIKRRSGTAELVKSKDIGKYHRIPTRAMNADLPAFPKYADDFVALVAWFWTEGHIMKSRGKQSGCAAIYQSHKVNAEHVKVVRHDFLLDLTLAQLELFISVSVAADGHQPASGGPNLAQKIRERSEAFGFACILAGRDVSYHTSDPRPGTTKMHLVSVNKRTSMAVAPTGMTPVEYDGDVWCPTTPNGTWLARYGSRVFFTGNSAAVDQAGRVWDCRGIHWMSAANGDRAVNLRWAAVTCLINAGDVPTPAMIQALRDWRRDVWLHAYPHATKVVGHGDLHPTECPGSRLRALVHAGAFTAAGPPDPEDDMPLTPDDLNAIARAVWRHPYDTAGKDLAEDRLFAAARAAGAAATRPLPVPPTADAVAAAVVARLGAGQGGQLTVDDVKAAVRSVLRDGVDGP